MAVSTRQPAAAPANRARTCGVPSVELPQAFAVNGVDADRCCTSNHRIRERR